MSSSLPGGGIAHRGLGRPARIEAILAAKLPLDESYIEHWAIYWDVLATWHSLR